MYSNENNSKKTKIDHYLYICQEMKAKYFLKLIFQEENIKTFIDKIYIKPPLRNYPTNKLIYNHIDEVSSIYLADFSDYKTSNNKTFSYIFETIDKFSKYLWAMPLKVNILEQ